MVPRTVGKIPSEPPLLDDYSNVVPANTNFPMSPVNIGFLLSGQSKSNKFLSVSWGSRAIKWANGKIGWLVDVAVFLYWLIRNYAQSLNLVCKSSLVGGWFPCMFCLNKSTINLKIKYKRLHDQTPLYGRYRLALQQTDWGQICISQSQSGCWVNSRCMHHWAARTDLLNNKCWHCGELVPLRPCHVRSVVNDDHMFWCVPYDRLMQSLYAPN